MYWIFIVVLFCNLPYLFVCVANLRVYLSLDYE